jgi:hypothetical protein
VPLLDGILPLLVMVSLLAPANSLLRCPWPLVSSPALNAPALPVLPLAHSPPLNSPLEIRPPARPTAGMQLLPPRMPRPHLLSRSRLWLKSKLLSARPPHLSPTRVAG